MARHENMPAPSRGREVLDPFDMLQSRIDKIFHDFPRGFGFPRGFWNDEIRPGWGGDGSVMPYLDMHEADGKVMIAAELPGVDENDIDISVEDDRITISGEKKSEVEHKEGETYRSERSYGHFYRTVSLPFSIDPEKVEARFDKGVLKLTVEKPPEAQQHVKKIAIKH